LGREVTVPRDPEHVICSGPGALRLLTYLEAEERAVAVDDMEGERPQFDARPYALANPQFKEMPIFGEFRGHDNPELIVALDPQPDLIFKTYPTMGTDPEELEKKTGIPVIALNYGDLGGYRDRLFTTIRTMAAVLDKEERGEEVITFFKDTIDELDRRTRDIPEEEKKSCFVGGIAFKGPHGFQSTEPTYPPFMFVNANNVAYDPQKSLSELEHADVAKEKIVAWDPDVLFVDLATIQSDSEANALYQLANDPAYTNLTAVENGKVYGVLPYNWYTQNFGSILADAYFIGTILYPDRFADITPEEKADEIYRFLVGEAVFDEIKAAFQDLVFERIPL
jgi:iron complex transport system substrate-binding protein